MASSQRSAGLDWQMGIKSISKRASKILDSGQWSDIVFIVGHDDRQQRIQAHRLILGMASPVFEAMFYGSMADKEDKPIEILDVTPHAFKALLRYIYTDEVQFTAFEIVCEICYAAKKYMISPLVEECLKYIWKDLHPGNVCRAHAFVLLFEESKLLGECMSMIKTRTQEVVADPSFEDAELTTIKTVLSQDTLSIPELLLWEGVVRWSKQECLRQNLDSNSVNQRKVMTELLPQLRFLTLTPTQFANGPALTNILTQEECFNLLMNISSPGVAPMPAGFSASTTSRTPAMRVAPRDTRSRQLFSPSIDLDEPDEQLFCNCAGPLSDTFINDEPVDCTLSFSVDRDMCIVGVVLPTQLKPQDPRAVDLYRDPQRERRSTFSNGCCSINKYPELIYAFVQDADGCRLTYTHFSARVPWENTMEVLFNKPIYICPNLNYTIVVVLNKIGRYPLYTTVSRMLTGDVNFTFFENHLNRESIVKALIFKSDPNRVSMDGSGLLTL